MYNMLKTLCLTALAALYLLLSGGLSNVTPPLKELYFGDHKDFVLRINGNNFEIGSKLKNGQYHAGLTITGEPDN
jgi:hypothetical protein